VWPLRALCADHHNNRYLEKNEIDQAFLVLVLQLVSAGEVDVVLDCIESNKVDAVLLCAQCALLFVRCVRNGVNLQNNLVCDPNLGEDRGFY
jgi:hypothetical protein